MKALIFYIPVGIVFGLFGLVSTLHADELTFSLTLKDHTFIPAQLSVPANKRFKLIVKNQDPTPEEFESYDLNREKVVVAGGEITLFIEALEPGEYSYFGEFHPNLAKGTIVAK